MKIKTRAKSLYGIKSIVNQAMNTSYTIDNIVGLMKQGKIKVNKTSIEIEE